MSDVNQELLLRVHINCDACGSSNPCRRCARCRLMYYCGRDCQKRHWPQHRPDCRSVEYMREQCAQIGATLPSSSDHDSISKAVNTECGICLDENIKDPVVLKECRHAFCFSCLKDWQAYASSLRSFTGYDASPSSSLSSSSSCPYCRQQIQVSLLEDCLEKAGLYTERAGKKSIPAEERSELYKLALENVDRALAGETAEGNQLKALWLKSQILVKHGNPQQAIECCKKMLRLDAEGAANSEEIGVLMGRVNDAVDAGDADEAERLMQLAEEFRIAYPNVQRFGSGPMRLATVKILLAEAHEAACEFDEAKNIYIELLKSIETPDTVPAAQNRMIFAGLSRCAYRLGRYDKAISGGEAALEMNRHFYGVHKLIALPLRELGRIDEAVATMSRAVLYETPWDDENIQENLELLRELQLQQQDQQADVSAL